VSVLGIAVEAKKAPILRAVVLHEHEGNHVVYDVFSHPAASQQEEELQLVEFGRAMRTHLSTVEVDAIVVRDRDRSPGPTKVDSVRRRALFDGVVVAVCRADCAHTRYLSGKDIGSKAGADKKTTEALAERLFGREFRDAGTAALAAWRIRP
jgi:hypothetical protein